MNKLYRVLLLTRGGLAFTVHLGEAEVGRLLLDWDACRTAPQTPHRNSSVLDYKQYPPDGRAPNGRWSLLWAELAGLDVTEAQSQGPTATLPGAVQPWRGGGSGYPN